MNPVDKFPFFFTVGKLSFTFIHEAEKYQRKRNSFEIGVRLFYALQVAVSLIALPLIILTGLIEVTSRALFCDGDSAIFALRAIKNLLAIHLLQVIPGLTVTIFSTRDTGTKVSKALMGLCSKIGDLGACIFGVNKESHESNPLVELPALRNRSEGSRQRSWLSEDEANENTLMYPLERDFSDGGYQTSPPGGYLCRRIDRTPRAVPAMAPPAPVVVPPRLVVQFSWGLEPGSDEEPHSAPF